MGYSSLKHPEPVVRQTGIMEKLGGLGKKTKFQQRFFVLQERCDGLFLTWFSHVAGAPVVTCMGKAYVRGATADPERLGFEVCLEHCTKGAVSRVLRCRSVADYSRWKVAFKA